jgi:hypothetical protein
MAVQPKSSTAVKSVGPVPPASPSGPSGPAPIDPNADFSTDKCALTLMPDGSGEAVVFVDPGVLKRIKTRAGNQDLANYLWLNVFRPALDGHVY